MLAFADVGVAVSDAEKSAKWWREKLGFEVTHLHGSEHAVLVAPPGDRFILHLCEGVEDVDPGNTGIAFMTDEIETLVRRMEDAGVTFTEPLEKKEWGASAKFEDPDGNEFALVGSPRALIDESLAMRAGGLTAR